MIPFIDLTRLTREILPAVSDDWSAQCAQADFIEGPHVSALELQLSRTLSAPHVIACANGTDALVLALLAMGVQPGHRVAMPALTFWATYEAIRLVGAIPVLIDVDPEDWQMSLPELLAAHDRYRFSFAILVHLFGWCSARLDGIRAACASRGINLLEDGAQAFGVEVAGEPVFAHAEVGTLSFYPAKVIGGCGDGGAVLCQSAETAVKLRSLRNHGRADGAPHAHDLVGMNSRMGAMQAAYLSRVVGMAERILERRIAALEDYAERIGGRRGMMFHEAPVGVAGNGYLAVVTCRDAAHREERCRALSRAGIGWGRTYPRTIADQGGCTVAEIWGDLAVGRTFCSRVLNLPMFYGIEAREVEETVRVLLEEKL